MHKMTTNTVVTILMITSLALISCKKDNKDESTTNTLFLYLLDQASGNCATISKSTTSGVTTYTATANGVPKGGCNESTLASYVATPAEAKTKSDSDYDARLAVLNSHSECSAIATAVTVLKNAVTATTIETAAAASSTGCTAVGGQGFAGASIYCKDAASLTTYKSNIRYKAISDAKTDMATNHTGSITAYTAQNTALGLKFTTSAIASLRVANATELTLLKSPSTGALLSATTSASCINKIYAANPDLKTLITKSYGLSSGETTITSAERAAVTETIQILGLTCRYGTNVTATTTSGFSAGIGLCPSSYESF